MNIFAISSIPSRCVRALDDRRLVKSVLENAQLLSTALGVGYKPTHANHPVTLWVGADAINTIWTLDLFEVSCLEYTMRFKRKHACEEMSKLFRDTIGVKRQIPVSAPTSFQNSARNTKSGLDFTHLPAHLAYILYLEAKWQQDSEGGRPPKWTGVVAPFVMLDKLKAKYSNHLQA